jgi:hypothetical protein
MPALCFFKRAGQYAAVSLSVIPTNYGKSYANS